MIRELKEEIGLKSNDIYFNRSKYYAPTNTLMLNFICISEDENLDKLIDEVDYAEWFTIEEARKHIKPDSLAQRFLEKYLEKKNDWNDWYLKL